MECRRLGPRRAGWGDALETAAELSAELHAFAGRSSSQGGSP